VNPIEEEAIKQYEALGYDVIKKGIPDLVLLKDGKIKFVEVKNSDTYSKGNDGLSPSQRRAFKLLEKHGFDVEIKRYRYTTNPNGLPHHITDKINKAF